MARRRDPRKEAIWRGVIEKQAASGMSVRAFCMQEGVSAPSFYAWRRKLTQGEDTPGGDLTCRVDNSDREKDFIPLTLVEPASAMEVLHPLGYRIRLTGHVDTTMLSRVLDAMERSVRS